MSRGFFQKFFFKLILQGSGVVEGAVESTIILAGKLRTKKVMVTKVDGWQLKSETEAMEWEREERVMKKNLDPKVVRGPKI